MAQETAIRIGLYIAGWALSIAWPFLLVAVTEGAKFDWRKVSGRILAGLLGLVGYLAADQAIGAIGALGYLAAFLAGFGASSVGNNVRRSVDAKRG
jgi:drug/metabolite transporter (DMT)-like permease